MAAAPPWARGPLVAAALAAAAVGEDAAAGEDATPTPPAVRYTWASCKCKETWEDDKGNVCMDYCCHFDSDDEEYYYYYYADDYCSVEDEDCEYADWGFCRPESMSTAGCTDFPPDWSDSDGDDCYAYMFNEFCTTTGGFGTQWDETWGTFQTFTKAGYDASTACCACGGGTHTFQGFNDDQCANTEGWEDSDGDDCATYGQNFYCAPDGKQGSGWHEEWGTLSSFEVSGVSALEACCACGGGTKGTYAGTEYTPRPDDDTAGVEVPSGLAWAVASGPCTKDGSDCILSPNYPKPYGNDEKCVIGVNVDKISFVTAEPFSTEWGYDTLTVNGQIYSGSMGPTYVWPMGAIVWTSDYEQSSKGWRLCPEGAASMTGTGALGVGSKALGVALVLGVVGAAAVGCWCRRGKQTVIGTGVSQEEH